MTEREVAVVTGASMGLGEQFAHLLAADGYDVVLVARSGDRLREIGQELEKKYNVQTHVVVSDFSKASAAEEVSNRLHHLGLKPAVLINNAGYGAQAEFVDDTLENQLGMIKVNILALVELTHRIGRDMVYRKRGKILNIASTAGFQPGPHMAVYYATKAFVISFSEALALELKPHGVSVTAHCPGPTATAFAKRAGNEKTVLFSMPGLVGSPAAVARQAYRKMKRGRVLVIYGWINWLLVQSLRFSPRFLVRRLSERINSQAQ